MARIIDEDHVRPRAVIVEETRTSLAHKSLTTQDRQCMTGSTEEHLASFLARARIELASD